MGNEASTTKKAIPSFGPVTDIMQTAKAEVKSPSKEMGLNALFIGCNQKQIRAVRACKNEERTTKRVACVKAAGELQGCLQANLDTIKELAASAHATKVEEYRSG